MMQYFVKVLTIIFFLVGISTALQVKAQDYNKVMNTDSAKTYKNNISLELLGKGLYYSFQYERLVLRRKKSQFLISVGIAPYLPNSYLYRTIPTLSVDYAHGKKWKLFLSEGFSHPIFLREKINNLPTYYFWFTGIGVSVNIGKCIFIRFYGSFIVDDWGPKDGVKLVSTNRIPWPALDFGYYF